jgi:hypothetical protein
MSPEIKEFPFLPLRESDRAKVGEGLLLVWYTRLGVRVYPSCTMLSQCTAPPGAPRGPHATAALLRHSNCYDAELWNTSHRKAWLSWEGLSAVVEVVPGIVVSLSASLDGSFRPVVHTEYPAHLVHGALYAACAATRSWVLQGALRGPLQKRERARSFDKMEVVAEEDGCHVAARAGTVHDGQFFADAVRAGLGRAPNERAFLGMRDPGV